MDYSLPGSSIHGIFQARILEWVAMPSSRRSSQPKDQTQISYVSCIGRQVLYHYCHLGSPQSTIFQLKKKQTKTRYYFCTKAAFILNFPTESCFSGKFGCRRRQVRVPGLCDTEKILPLTNFFFCGVSTIP